MRVSSGSLVCAQRGLRVGLVLLSRLRVRRLLGRRVRASGIRLRVDSAAVHCAGCDYSRRGCCRGSDILSVFSFFLGVGWNNERKGDFLLHLRLVVHVRKRNRVLAQHSVSSVFSEPPVIETLDELKFQDLEVVRNRAKSVRKTVR